MADSESNKRLTRPGTNFAGKYVVIVWGCGSQCGFPESGLHSVLGPRSGALAGPIIRNIGVLSWLGAAAFARARFELHHHHQIIQTVPAEAAQPAHVPVKATAESRWPTEMPRTSRGGTPQWRSLRHPEIAVKLRSSRGTNPATREWTKRLWKEPAQRRSGPA